MLILGIESSCDETAAAVVEDGRRVLSNAVLSQIPTHRVFGGVVPEVASRCHIEAISGIVDAALEDAHVGLNDIDAVAVTYAPGLIGALLVGVNYAKGLCYAADKPLVPVNHLRGHIAALYLSHADLQPPFCALVASGGHSSLVKVDGYTSFTQLGRAVDDAAGEAFDKVARVLGLPYPGGPEIARIAENGDPFAYHLPDPHTEQPLDVSFSGLKTAVINIVNTAKMKGTTIDAPSLAASFQHRAVEMLSERLVSAADGVAALCGGVAANAALRNACEQKCSSRGIRFICPELKYCGDNAAMIAAQGYHELLSGNIASYDLNASATAEI